MAKEWCAKAGATITANSRRPTVHATNDDINRICLTIFSFSRRATDVL